MAKYRSVQYSTVRQSALYSTVQYSTVQCSTVQYGKVQCCTVHIRQHQVVQNYGVPKKCWTKKVPFSLVELWGPEVQVPQM